MACGETIIAELISLSLLNYIDINKVGYEGNWRYPDFKDIRSKPFEQAVEEIVAENTAGLLTDKAILLFNRLKKGITSFNVNSVYDVLREELNAEESDRLNFPAAKEGANSEELKEVLDAQSIAAHRLSQKYLMEYTMQESAQAVKVSDVIIAYTAKDVAYAFLKKSLNPPSVRERRNIFVEFRQKG